MYQLTLQLHGPWQSMHRLVTAVCVCVCVHACVRVCVCVKRMACVALVLQCLSSVGGVFLKESELT